MAARPSLLEQAISASKRGQEKLFMQIFAGFIEACERGITGDYRIGVENRRMGIAVRDRFLQEGFNTSFLVEENIVLVHWGQQFPSPIVGSAPVSSTKVRDAIDEYHSHIKEWSDCGYSAKGTDRGRGWLALKRRGPVTFSPPGGTLCLNVGGFKILIPRKTFHARGGVEFRFPQ